MPPASSKDLLHLRKHVRDALELAIAAHAPWSMLEPLAVASGMLEALSEIPEHALVVSVMTRAETAMAAWRKWDESQKHRKVPA